MNSVNMTEFGLLHWEYDNPQRFEAFSFEKVDGNELRFWAKQNVFNCAVICALYILFIWLGPKWMKNRKAFKLDKPLVVWNFFLALFSLTVVIRVAPELNLLYSLPNGFYRSICLVEGLSYPTTFWGFLFLVSKVVELGDTVFIVLRKKPLIFLHWFHHFNMVWSSFLLFIEGEPGLRWPVIVNASVHTLMYTYYGLRAMRIKVPLKVSMMITSLQIMQFVTGLAGQYYQFFVLPRNGIPCYRTKSSYIITTIFGFSYLFLFLRLFYTSYILKEKKKVA